MNDSYWPSGPHLLHPLYSNLTDNEKYLTEEVLSYEWCLLTLYPYQNNQIIVRFADFLIQSHTKFFFPIFWLFWLTEAVSGLGPKSFRSVASAGVCFVSVLGTLFAELFEMLFWSSISPAFHLITNLSMILKGCF